MFIGMMISGILSIVAVLIAVGLAANAVWRATVAPAGLPRGAGCGSCGYELTTLTAGRCSECGADLLKAGVSTRHNVIRNAGSLPAALLGWTLIVMIIGVVITYVAAMVAMTQTFSGAAAGGGMAYTSNYSFRPARLGPAADGTRQTTPDFRVAVDADVTGNWGMPANSGVITLTLTSGEQEAVMTFEDAADTAWVLTGPDGVEIARDEYPTQEGMEAAFVAVGLDPQADPRLAEYAAQVVTLADEALNDPFSYESTVMMNSMNSANGVSLQQAGGTSNFAGMGGMMGTGSISDYIVPLAVLGVSTLIWIGGVVFIVRRRSKLTQPLPVEAT